MAGAGVRLASLPTGERGLAGTLEVDTVSMGHLEYGLSLSAFNGLQRAVFFAKGE
jgi:hypothetical protein